MQPCHVPAAVERPKMNPLIKIPPKPSNLSMKYAILSYLFFPDIKTSLLPQPKAFFLLANVLAKPPKNITASCSNAGYSQEVTNSFSQI